MRRVGPTLFAAIAVAAIATSCGDRHGVDWVASEVYVVDDRSSCMTVTDRDGGREVGVCRDNQGRVTCRIGPERAAVISGRDCDAAVRAVRNWEESGGT